MKKVSGWIVLKIRGLLKTVQRSVFKELLVIGDSHVRILSTNRVRFAFPFYYIKRVAVGGATVSGLENPNSKTQAFDIFMKAIRESNAKKIVVILGEVDTGFVIWYRAEKYQTNVSFIFDEAVKKYQKFLLLLSEDHEVICVSTPLPTIIDGQEWGPVADARKEVKATQLERTNLTLSFNKEMKEFCENNKITYVDLDSQSLGDNGLVDNRLLRKDPYDHHYDPTAYSKLIISGLRGKL